MDAEMLRFAQYDRVEPSMLPMPLSPMPRISSASVATMRSISSCPPPVYTLPHRNDLVTVLLYYSSSMKIQDSHISLLVDTLLS